MGGHVEVVQEAEQTLPACWDEHTFGSFLQAALYNGLDVPRGGLDKDKNTKDLAPSTKHKDPAC